MAPPLNPPRAALCFGSLTLDSKFLLAPMAGHTDLPFRLALRELGGVGMATTDMLNARALVDGGRKTLFLAETCPEDAPLAGQIYGRVPEELAAAAKWLEAQGFDAVDVNMGCPARKIVRKGNGVALMREPDLAVALVAAVVEAVRIPVTVKMRLGWDPGHVTAPPLAKEFERLGVAGVTVHGRTRDQFYAGEVDLTGIRAVVQSVEHMPVIGNGNVSSVGDARRMFETTGCAGVGIGRAALSNPFIFVQLQRWATTGDPGACATFDERIEFVARHFQLLVAIKGETLACHLVRKFATHYRRLLDIPRKIYAQIVVVKSADEFAENLSMIRSWQPDTADS